MKCSYFMSACALATLVAALSAPVTAGASASATITLAWDPSPDPSVVGYRLYEGVASQTYTNQIDTGNATSATLTGLTPGVTYFFAVTDYDSNGLESSFSSELSYTVPLVPTAPVTLRMTMTAPKQVRLTATGPVGYTYDVLAAQNLTNWTKIGSATVDATGSVQFTDSGATNASRFYRFRQTSP